MYKISLDKFYPILISSLTLFLNKVAQSIINYLKTGYHGIGHLSQILHPMEEGV